MNDHITEEGVDNTTAIANIVETGDLHEVAMILGDRERVRHSGVIRPGIKIPLSGCNEKQKKIYADMLDEGHGFEAIDAAMLQAADKSNTKKTCLRPANSDYFTIRDEDFRRPEDAQYIRKNFADADGRVRRIPCWFSQSDINKVMPHNFRAFSKGGLRCVSFYDGNKLKFKYLPKSFQGVPKAEDWKVLDTDDEAKATAACGIDVKFGGMYRVYVPGTRGAGELICPTQSWYGLGESVGVLRRVRSILGRFDGLLNGNAFFELCKVPEMVKTPDGKRQQQWIVTLELAVDPMELARYAEPAAVAARSASALSLLTGRREPVPEVSVANDLECLGAVADQVAAADVPPVQAADAGSAPQPAESFDRKLAIESLSGLVMPHNLTLFEILIYGESQGVCSGDANTMTKEEFTALYKDTRAALKEDADGFVAMVRDIAGTEQVSADDEPF